MAIVYVWLILLAFPTPGQFFPGYNSPPIFDFKREWKIPENEPVGSRITRVTARDLEDNPLTFGLEPAAFVDGSGYFKIDPKSGDVTLVKSLQNLADNDFYLVVSAHDGFTRSKIEVYVRVLKANSRTQPELVIPLTTKLGKPYTLPPPSKVTTPKQRRPPFRTPPRPNISSNTTGSSDLESETTVINSNTSTTPSVASEKVPETTQSTPHEKNGRSAGLDITVSLVPIITIVGFVPLIGFIAWLIQRKCKDKHNLIIQKKSSTRSQGEKDKKTEANETSPDPSVFFSRKCLRAESNRYESDNPTLTVSEDMKWEFPRHHLRIFGILGEGCFGQVWKCEALNIGNVEGTQTVAVKTLKENATEKEKQDLLSELSVMKILDPHPNVVQLYGACTEKDPIFLIMEFVPHGKLQSYLRNSRAERYYGNLHGSSNTLSSRDLTTFAYQVARGMEYLSSKGIIHRDLAARNILVGENKTCKVADFGFARDVIVSHVYERKSEGRLPIRWMAPESLYDNIFTTKTDVWSFGILMWEIVTLGSTPYPGMGAGDVMRKVRDGYRLEKPEHCKREIYNIMYYCWDKDSLKRPQFTELVHTLEDLMVSENDYIELDRFPDHSYYNIIQNLSGERL